MVPLTNTCFEETAQNVLQYGPTWPDAEWHTLENQYHFPKSSVVQGGYWDITHQTRKTGAPTSIYGKQPTLPIPTIAEILKICLKHNV